MKPHSNPTAEMYAENQRLKEELKLAKLTISQLHKTIREERKAMMDIK